jgi:hypothetical protein
MKSLGALFQLGAGRFPAGIPADEPGDLSIIDAGVSFGCAFSVLAPATFAPGF